ncbi:MULTISPECIES: potassium channel family protein [Pseudomonas]|uniref:potassium channel family protein n=1 Tax=Pseudomonadaceae TaxID=135621 RepID=UPI0010F75CF9|nr:MULTISPECIES: potassium channel family protein [Pseudomonas]MDE3736290.1 potassium channel family protein [Pseudomonas resinovorans]
MLINLLVGIPVMVLCLFMQSVFVAFSLRPYIHYVRGGRVHLSRWRVTLLLSAVMLVMLLGNFVQMAVWGALFLMLGEFDSFATAIYHSGVNFATLGYGDIVMTEQWRLLGPLEAANGILMFGVSTAVMTATVSDLIKHKFEEDQSH